MATINATNTPQLTTNGQVIIGSTGAFPVAATLTAGANITITNAAGSITIAGANDSGPFTVVTTNTALVANNRYGSNGSSLVFTLPASAAVGDTYEVTGMNHTYQIAQNASQQINGGSQSTTSGAGGSLTSTENYNWIRITCTVANTTFNIMGMTGDFTIV